MVALLVAVVLVSGGLLAVSVRSATEKSEAEKSKIEAGLVFKNDPNFSLRTASSSGSQELLFKMMLSVLLVVVLGAAAFYLSRKLLPKIANLPGKQIHILETTHLGPKKAVHLIEIGNQWGPRAAGVKRLLIGSTSESITTLADVTSTLSEFSTQTVENNGNRGSGIENQRYGR